MRFATNHVHRISIERRCEFLSVKLYIHIGGHIHITCPNGLPTWILAGCWHNKTHSFGSSRCSELLKWQARWPPDESNYPEAGWRMGRNPSSRALQATEQLSSPAVVEPPHSFSKLLSKKQYPKQDILLMFTILLFQHFDSPRLGKDPSIPMPRCRLSFTLMGGTLPVAEAMMCDLIGTSWVCVVHARCWKTRHEWHMGFSIYEYNLI